jgi:hypothetical protein
MAEFQPAFMLGGEREADHDGLGSTKEKGVRSRCARRSLGTWERWQGKPS